MVNIKISGHNIKIAKEDKILFGSNITKLELIEYYENIADIMLKHIKNRPVMMKRYPNGINGKFFYQKNASKYFPKWIKTVYVKLKSSQENKYNNYVLCQNKATLVYLANQAVLEYHIWLSTINSINYPDKLIFDLDPAGDNFDILRQCALLLKDLLENIGLVPYIMTTGIHGLHVVCPIKQSKIKNKLINFEKIKKFADLCANKIISLKPDLFTMKLRKDIREKKLFIDTLRNQYGATAICPYSTRARPNCTIATPLEWHEISQKDMNSQKYNIKNIFDRIKKIGDPWQDFFKNSRSIYNAIEKFKKL